MKTTNIKRSNAATHLFVVGQTVQIKGGIRTAAAEKYRITGTLPPKGNSPQYRIQNPHERHERVITQELIELVSASPVNNDDTLIENTFSKLTKLSTTSGRREIKGPAVGK